MLDMLTLFGLGGSAALPLALRKIPKGAISLEQHKAEIDQLKTAASGNKEPGQKS